MCLRDQTNIIVQYVCSEYVLRPYLIDGSRFQLFVILTIVAYTFNIYTIVVACLINSAGPALLTSLLPIPRQLSLRYFTITAFNGHNDSIYGRKCFVLRFNYVAVQDSLYIAFALRSTSQERIKVFVAPY